MTPPARLDGRLEPQPVEGSEEEVLQQRLTTLELEVIDTNLEIVFGTVSLISGGALKVTATDLDIRDLDWLQDSVEVFQDAATGLQGQMRLLGINATGGTTGQVNVDFTPEMSSLELALATRALGFMWSPSASVPDDLDPFMKDLFNISTGRPALMTAPTASEKGYYGRVSQAFAATNAPCTVLVSSTGCDVRSPQIAIINNSTGNYVQINHIRICANRNESAIGVTEDPALFIEGFKNSTGLAGGAVSLPFSIGAGSGLKPSGVTILSGGIAGTANGRMVLSGCFTQHLFDPLANFGGIALVASQSSWETNLDAEHLITLAPNENLVLNIYGLAFGFFGSPHQLKYEIQWIEKL
ncbi:MAG: hypothetical protein KAS32_21240 [Candidatus Peribacteraceae bacterium]|nr:hypothetical protein [Candidatus Peribacteraceae bacterium]